MPLVQKEVKAVYIGSRQVWPEAPYAPGIYHNPSQGYITMSSDGYNWLTIADKNLGATKYLWQSWATDEEIQGNYFQWWNCYGFPNSGATTTSSTRVDVTWTSANGYSSSTFITIVYNWFTGSDWKNLWWWESSSPSDWKGPCSNGFHIMSRNEFQTVIPGIIRDLTWWTLPSSWKQDYGLFINNVGCLNRATWQKENNTMDWMWTAEGYHSTSMDWAIAFTVNAIQWTSWAYAIRPVLNNSIVPDSSRTVLLQGS